MNAIKCFLTSIFIIFYSNFLLADTSDIFEKYEGLISNYNQSLSEGNYDKAYSSAKELLEIDPSDVISYLRLAIAARELNINISEIKNMYEDQIGQANKKEESLKLLVSSLLSSPRKFDCYTDSK